MKTRHSKYSFALSIHSVIRTKPLQFRRISTSLHRRILTSQGILYCMKRILHKFSLTLRHIGHTRTNNGFFKLVEALLQTHSCFFSQVQMYVAYPYQHVTVSLHYLPRCVRSRVSCSKTPANVI